MTNTTNNKINITTEQKEYKQSNNIVNKTMSKKRKRELYPECYSIDDSTKEHKKTKQDKKKPMTTFIRFSKDTRKYVKELHPEYNKVEVTKELARLWNNDITKEVKEVKIVRRYNKNKAISVWFQDCCKNWSLNLGFCLYVYKKRFSWLLC